MSPDRDAFIPHEVEWTRQAAQRFWDYEGSDERRWAKYFSRQVGDGLLEFASKRVGISGEVLDFGCGPGFLVEKMLAKGYSVTALDFSEGSLEALRQRLGQPPGLRAVVHATSVPTPLEDASFDRVFLIETVEHLMPADLSATLADVARVLKPGSMLVTTTPNDEDLESHKLICPDCGATFHPRQHVSSWTADRLSALLEGAGLEVVTSEALLLRPSSPLNPLRDFVWGRSGRKPPHLVAIARRRP